MSARNELYEKILIMLTGVGIDVADIKSDIQIILSEYEVQERSTEIVLRNEDRNEYLIKKFLMAKIVKGCTERTIDHYKKELEFIFSRLNKTADNVEADDIRLYLAIRQKKDGITKTTAGNELLVLRTFYSYLMMEELVTKNPTLKIDRIKPDTKKEKAFTDLEVEKIRNCLKNAREKALVEVMLSTGCRVSELVQMKREEVKEGAIVVHGKGEKDRICYLNVKAMVALQNYMDERKDDNPYIFCGGREEMFKHTGIGGNEAGEWYRNKEFISETHTDKCTVENIVRKIGKRCGIKNVHPHRFRKTCATMALRRGMPIEKVSKMLGHEQLDTTKIYISIDEEEMEQAHRKYVI